MSAEVALLPLDCLSAYQAMLFKISLAHPAVFAQRHGLIRDGQIGKQIVAAEMIGQFHTNLLSNTKKQLWT